MIRKMAKSNGFGNKFRAVFYGPGFNPKKPQFRLGDPKDLPKAKNAEIYDPQISVSVQFYAVSQALLASFVMEHFIKLQSRKWLKSHEK